MESCALSYILNLPYCILSRHILPRTILSFFNFHASMLLTLNILRTRLGILSLALFYIPHLPCCWLLTHVIRLPIISLFNFLASLLLTRNMLRTRLGITSFSLLTFSTFHISNFEHILKWRLGILSLTLFLLYCQLSTLIIVRLCVFFFFFSYFCIPNYLHI